MKPPHPISSSTSIKLLLNAAPKCISGSTSYFRVWLAFHPYPQVIRTLFNVYRFGPPLWINKASPCPWVDHTVSRLLLLTMVALFRLAFATDPHLKCLTLLETVTRRLIMQKARRHPKGLRPLVSVWFQDLFHSLIQGSFHLSLTVLVHYRSLRSI